MSDTRAEEIEQQHLVIKELFKEKADDVIKVRSELNRVSFESYKMRTQQSKPIFKKRQEAVKDLPRFWFISMLNCQDMNTYINVVDHEILNQLKDVWIEFDEEDPRNVEVTFTFGPNDYFEEESLTKKIRVVEPKDSTPESIKYDLDAPLKGEPVKITWKSDEKNLCKKAPFVDVENMEDFDEFEGLGSFFHYFAGEQNPTEITEDLTEWWQNAIEWFSNFMGEDIDDDEDEDEDEDEDLDAEIDLEAPSDDESRPSKKAKKQEEKK